MKKLMILLVGVALGIGILIFLLPEEQKAVATIQIEQDFNEVVERNTPPDEEFKSSLSEDKTVLMLESKTPMPYRMAGFTIGVNQKVTYQQQESSTLLTFEVSSKLDGNPFIKFLGWYYPFAMADFLETQTARIKSGLEK